MLVLLRIIGSIILASLHLLIALLLLAQDQLFLSVEQSLSGLTLAGHHKLRGEVASCLVGSATFCTDHRLALNYAIAKSLFMSFHYAHCRCL